MVGPLSWSLRRGLSMIAFVSTLGSAANSFGDFCKPIVPFATLGSGMGSLKVTILFFFYFDNADISSCPLSFC